MNLRELTHFLTSGPASGGEKERLRQERILNTTKDLLKSEEEAEILQMQSLQRKRKRTEVEDSTLCFLKRCYPDEASRLQDS